MATFTMMIPDELLPDILDAFEYAYPIPVDEEEIPTMTQAANARMQLRRYVREIHKAYKAKTDSEAARLAAIEAAETASEGIEVD